MQKHSDSTGSEELSRIKELKQESYMLPFVCKNDHLWQCSKWLGGVEI